MKTEETYHNYYLDAWNKGMKSGASFVVTKLGHMWMLTITYGVD